MSVSGRIGCFLILVGVLLVVLFLASDAAKAPEVSLLLLGVLGLGFGVVLWRSGVPKPEQSSRFAIVRRLRERKEGVGAGAGGGTPGGGGKGGGGPAKGGGPPKSGGGPSKSGGSPPKSGGGPPKSGGVPPKSGGVPPKSGGTGRR